MLAVMCVNHYVNFNMILAVLFVNTRSVVFVIPQVGRSVILI